VPVARLTPAGAPAAAGPTPGAPPPATSAPPAPAADPPPVVSEPDPEPEPDDYCKGSDDGMTEAEKKAREAACHAEEDD
jgi:hypothetical protein